MGETGSLTTQTTPRPDRHSSVSRSASEGSRHGPWLRGLQWHYDRAVSSRGLSMARLAFMTFGVLREPWGSPGVAGFEARLDRVFAAADLAPGMIARDDTEITD